MPISASLKKMLILSGINFDKKEDLFHQAKKSLKKFKGDIATGDNVSGSTAAVKLESAFVTTTQEEALATSAHLNQRGRSWFCSCGYRRPSNFKGRHEPGGAIERNEYTRPINPTGRDGNPLTCHGCGSYTHFLEACPHSYQNASRTQKVNAIDSTAESGTENANIVVLITGYNKSEIG